MKRNLYSYIEPQAPDSSITVYEIGKASMLCRVLCQGGLAIQIAQQHDRALLPPTLTAQRTEGD
jgi:hypothetical protein